LTWRLPFSAGWFIDRQVVANVIKSQFSMSVLSTAGLTVRLLRPRRRHAPVEHIGLATMSATIRVEKDPIDDFLV